MDKRKIMRDIGLNDPVELTLPAHVWHGYLVWYSHAKGGCEDASTIAKEAIRLLFDPLYLNEKEAAVEEEREKHHMAIHKFLTGQSPELPPNREDPA